MRRSVQSSRRRLSAMAFALSGVLFVLYPALRPFSDEVTLRGAEAFGSSQWLLAHMLAMVAFTLVPIGLLGLLLSFRNTSVEREAYWALVLSVIGIGLTLPFYGGEAYGLYAIGQEAIRQESAALLSLATVVRSGPGLILFLVGLVSLGVAAIFIAAAIWRSKEYAKWSGIPLAVGFALYIPQFFGSQPIRVAHGLLVALGCLWIAASLLQPRPDG